MDDEQQIPTRRTGKGVVGDDGQVTIPKVLRDSLGIRPGDVIEFEEEPDGRLVGRKVADRDFLEGLRGSIQLPASVDEIIDEMRGGPYDSAPPPEDGPD